RTSASTSDQPGFSTHAIGFKQLGSLLGRHSLPSWVCPNKDRDYMRPNATQEFGVVVQAFADDPLPRWSNTLGECHRGCQRRLNIAPFSLKPFTLHPEDGRVSLL